MIENAINNVVDNQLVDEGCLGKLIERATAGDVAKHRAKRIARTETTGTMNAGQAAVLNDLADQGGPAGEQWLAVMDEDTRDSHAELNGKHVGPSRSPARIRVILGLPADERINCRCTIVLSAHPNG